MLQPVLLYNVSWLSGLTKRVSLSQMDRERKQMLQHAKSEAEKAAAELDKVLRQNPFARDLLIRGSRVETPL